MAVTDKNIESIYHRKKTDFGLVLHALKRAWGKILWLHWQEQRGGVHHLVLRNQKLMMNR